MSLDLKKIHLFRLPRGDDLIEALTAYCRDQAVTHAVINGLGVTSRTVLGYFDRATKGYREFLFEEDVEVLNLTGNVSLKEGRPMIHAHMTIADKDGQTHGGHVLPGCRVFVFEAMLFELKGDGPHRVADEETGLFLWPTWRP
ncbi:MAG: DNA-binding protein [Proteobacteria bacterium]|nr:DNA-binding protein [Pseudomonadota bacterium]MBU1741697.1 DNA-binding protein [Pseudomonadota bacterium]